MEQQTKKYSKETLETFSRMFYNYMSDLVGNCEDKKNIDGFEVVRDLELEKQFTSLNIINKEAAIKAMNILEANMEKRNTLIANLKTEVASKWKKGTVVKDVDIINCGNYYIGHFIYDDDTLEKAYAIWYKNGNIATSGYNAEITPLDNNSFIHSERCHNYQYIINEELRGVFYWNSDDKKWNGKTSFIATPELLDKGIIIIHADGCLRDKKKDYVYSFKENKILSQGFDKIGVEEIIGDEKVDYVKEYNCLKATCVVSSNIEGEEQITNEIVGKLNLEGKIMESVFNMNTGTTYSIPESNNVDKLAINVQKELNAQVLEQKERKEQAKKAYQKIFPINPQN